MPFPASPVNNQKYYSDDGRTYNYNSTNNSWDVVFAESLSIPKQNVTTTNPAATDDKSTGYSIGSLWINTSTKTIYRLVDDTKAAAVWQLQTPTISATPPLSPILGQVYYNSSNQFTYVFNGSAWVDITVLSNTYPTNNLTATVDPTVTDGTSGGYTVGSRWFNTTTNDVFICIDPSNTAAVWKKMTNNLFPSLIADPTTPVAGDTWRNTTSNLFKGFDGTIVKTFSTI